MCVCVHERVRNIDRHFIELFKRCHQIISHLAEQLPVINDDFAAVLIRDFPSVKFITRIFIPSPILWTMTEKGVFMLSLVTLLRSSKTIHRSKVQNKTLPHLVGSYFLLRSHSPCRFSYTERTSVQCKNLQTKNVSERVEEDKMIVSTVFLKYDIMNTDCNKSCTKIRTFICNNIINMGKFM